ncbi:MAG TPA: GNAT family N-acetyltransferase [Ignavibacteria bacterium]|nr:GNAT family N-acetyltransferase [Ignavibacteria bacterium]
MVILTDKKILEKSLRRNAALNIYQIGDLDDFFWKYTTWYGDDAQEPKNIVLVYAGVTPPTMISLTDDVAGMTALLKNVKQSLPGKFFCHLTPGLIDVFGKEAIIEDYGLHYKMTLRNLNTGIKIVENKIRQLTIHDIEVIKHFYSFSYIGNWFDKRMLETGIYYGYFEPGANEEELIGIAGIHIYSPEYRVAAIGNVTTHPEHRGKGIATQVTYKLCTELLKKVDYIGLNVMPDNEAAIRSYKKIGFEVSAEYEEYCLGR